MDTPINYKPPNRLSSADYFKLKPRIEKLRQLSKQGAPIDVFVPLLKIVAHGISLRGGSIDNPTIYRSRKNLSGKLFSHVDELKYPSQNLVLKKGRLNDTHESILYAALDILGTITETNPEINKLFTIATIQKESKDEVLFISLGILEGIHKQVPRNKAEALVIDFLNDEMTKVVPEEAVGNEYNSTIAISHAFLRAGVYGHMAPNLILAYPSVKAAKYRNTTTINLAMLPELFDGSYQISEATVHCVTIEGDHLQLNPINKGSVAKDGSLVWQFTYAEMRERIRNGLLPDGKIYEGIVGALD